MNRSKLIFISTLFKQGISDDLNQMNRVKKKGRDLRIQFPAWNLVGLELFCDSVKIRTKGSKNRIVVSSLTNGVYEYKLSLKQKTI